MPPFSPFTGKYWAKLMHRTCAGLCHAERGNQGDYRQKLRTIRKSEYGSSTADVKQAAHTVLNVSDSPISKLSGNQTLVPVIAKPLSYDVVIARAGLLLTLYVTRNQPTTMCSRIDACCRTLGDARVGDSARTNGRSF